MRIQPKRFSIVWFGRHVGLNLSMCAKTQSIFQLHESASMYMRVSIAAARPKKTARGLFCMFRLAKHSPREALLIAYDSSYRDELWFMPPGQGTSSGGLGLLRKPVGHEMVPRAAVRAGHIIDYKGAAFVSIKARFLRFAQNDIAQRNSYAARTRHFNRFRKAEPFVPHPPVDSPICGSAGSRL